MIMQLVDILSSEIETLCQCEIPGRRTLPGRPARLPAGAGLGRPPCHHDSDGDAHHIGYLSIHWHMKPKYSEVHSGNSKSTGYCPGRDCQCPMAVEKSIFSIGFGYGPGCMVGVGLGASLKEENQIWGEKKNIFILSNYNQLIDYLSSGRETP